MIDFLAEEQPARLFPFLEEVGPWSAEIADYLRRNHPNLAWLYSLINSEQLSVTERERLEGMVQSSTSAETHAILCAMLKFSKLNAGTPKDDPSVRQLDWYITADKAVGTQRGAERATPRQVLDVIFSSGVADTRVDNALDFFQTLLATSSASRLLSDLNSPLSILVYLLQTVARQNLKFDSASKAMIHQLIERTTEESGLNALSLLEEDDREKIMRILA
eukprot:TRINITY_DN4768_c0_g2_i1.p1 TRINITY_DN4768_c0_g2~~TRINITY_DN4768_c0_g2_i1.p1  ORF type:complete len:220 (+),score=43.99 TRINITY_DN4768_c0_g2_i1:174-833(+)